MQVFTSRLQYFTISPIPIYSCILKINPSKKIIFYQPVEGAAMVRTPCL